MTDSDLYAVLTGDLVKSTRFDRDAYAHLQSVLKRTFKDVAALCNESKTRPGKSKSHHGNRTGRNTESDGKTGSNHETGSGRNTSFGIYRGDSFQGLLPWPETALTASLYIRAALRSEQPENSDDQADARIAIGIGTIDYLPEEIAEGDGDAFRRSGPKLDSMKSATRLLITTPWEDVNHEMATQTALLDTVIARWTPEQAETILMLLTGKSRQEIGKELDISQAAVHYRVKGSGWPAIKKLLERYKEVIYTKVKN